MFTGNLTSSRPKCVQQRPIVHDPITQRIVDLKSVGMGFRMISKQMKIEGLADISKSTVENRWNQAQAQKYLPSKKSTIFKKTEAKLLEQVNQIRIDKQRSERIRDLQLQRAETPEGRQEIFKNSAELLEFAQQTVSEYSLKDFELICNEKGLPIAKTLSDIVGPLEKYEEENKDMCMWPTYLAISEKR